MTELQTLTYTHDGVTLHGQLAMPAGSGPHPGVMVMYDARGLGEQVRRSALRLAAAGYAALATDMYGGGQFHAKASGAGSIFLELQKNPQRLRGRVMAGFSALRGVANVAADRIGAIGYCFGGQCVLELARMGAPARAVVSLHGLLTSQLPARAGEVKAKVLVLNGARDPYVPPEHVVAFQSEMNDAGVDWQLTHYGEGLHAFTEPGAGEMGVASGVRYDAVLDRLSWAQATAFLDVHLHSQDADNCELTRG
jgi:dienelactone hydrolase